MGMNWSQNLSSNDVIPIKALSKVVGSLHSDVEVHDRYPAMVKIVCEDELSLELYIIVYYSLTNFSCNNGTT